MINHDSRVHTPQRAGRGRTRSKDSRVRQGQIVAAKNTTEVLTLVVIAILLLLGAFLTSGPPAASPSLLRLRVQAGDSLWTVAKSHPVDGLSTAQVAELVAARNGLSGAGLVPGQELLVPAGDAGQQFASR